MSAPYEDIAVCVDDTEASRLALAEAARLHGLGGRRLAVVHVVPTPLLYTAGSGGWIPDPAELSEGARRWLDELCAGVPGAEPVVLDGHPATTACDWARDERTDLLVAAAHRGAVARILLGSFAAYLAHHAPCPVLLVRPADR